MRQPLPGNRKLALGLAAVVVVMVGLAFAAVPLYRLFCQVTGFGGTTQVAEQAPSQVAAREITILFDASTSPELPWHFRPAQRQVKIKVGEPALIHYLATNLADRATVGTATFNVTPLKAGQYFNKVQCFCFTEQTLQPGEEASLGVSFFIDPAILGDRNLDDVNTITLSYTFFVDPDQSVQAGPAEGATR